MTYRIIRNSAFCRQCGDGVESRHRHDYVSCRCRNVSVDGGHAYLRRAVRDEAMFEDTSITIGDATG